MAIQSFQQQVAKRDNTHWKWFAQAKDYSKRIISSISTKPNWNKHFKGNKADSWRTTRWMPLKYANKKPDKRDQIKSNDDLINVMMKMRPGKSHQPCWMHDFSVRVTSTSPTSIHAHSLARSLTLVYLPFEIWWWDLHWYQYRLKNNAEKNTLQAIAVNSVK